MKTLKDISWQVDEPTYRADKALSYSTLSTYEREGRFSKLPTLFDRKESPSLLWGSVLDTILTDGMDAFNEQFYMEDIPDMTPTMRAIGQKLWDSCNRAYECVEMIPDAMVHKVCLDVGYQPGWGATAHKNHALSDGAAAYYSALQWSENKTIISSTMYNEVIRAAEALRTAPSTSCLFGPEVPGWERFFQLKFKATLEGVPYRCMFDGLLCNHELKVIIPVDLKSSSKKEYDFPKSFVEWLYMLQAKLYTAILKDNLARDEQFKDYEIRPYIFMVVNNHADPHPLAWEFRESLNTDRFYYGKSKSKYIRGPLEIGTELYRYLQENPALPFGVSDNEPNDLIKWYDENIE